MSELEERSSELKGVSTFVKPYREYYEAARYLPHVLGYVGSITAEELESFNAELEKEEGSVPYSPHDIVGKMGIERAAERLLRGVQGRPSWRSMKTEKTTKSYLEQPASPGQDIYLTIDLELRKSHSKLLKMCELIRKNPNKNKTSVMPIKAVVVRM